MRAIPLLRVEVDGVVASRPGELHVMLYDCTGKPTVSCMRPKLLPGEVLQERLGRIPAILKETPCHP